MFFPQISSTLALTPDLFLDTSQVLPTYLTANRLPTLLPLSEPSYKLEKTSSMLLLSIRDVVGEEMDKRCPTAEEGNSPTRSCAHSSLLILTPILLLDHEPRVAKRGTPIRARQPDPYRAFQTE